MTSDATHTPTMQGGDAPATGLLAGRIGRFGSVYAVASMSGLVFGLAQLAIVTRFLAPASFGHLAVLLLFATVLTLLYNTGSLQGTISWAHGKAGDEDTGDLDEDDDEQAQERASDPRRALTTGIAFTAALGILGGAAVFAAGSSISELLVPGAEDGRKLVALAAAAGGTAAIWRLASNTLRIQRREKAYFASAVGQHFLGMVAATAFLIAGLGLSGVLLGITIGNSLSSVYTLFALRRELRLAVAWSDLGHIFRRGRAMVPVVVSFQVMMLGDVFFASRFLEASQVGLYRAGSRIGSVMSYWASAFQMAWGPMRRDPLHVAADAELGRLRINAVVATYWVLVTAGMILGLALLADELVRVAGDRYSEAAAVIPLSGLAFCLHGGYILVYRASEFPNLRRWFIRFSMVCATTFVVAAVVLIPPLGIYGPSVAMIIGWSVGIVAIYLRAQLGPTPVPYQYRRILGGIAVAGALYGASRVLPGGGLAGVAISLLLLTLYPLLLVGVQIVPRYHRLVVRSVIRTRLAERRARPAQIGRVGGLPAADLALVDLLVRKRIPVAELAELAGTSEGSLLRRFVGALRTLAGEAPIVRPSDDLLGAHLVGDGPRSQRDHEARDIFAGGVDPLECDRLRTLVERLGRTRPETWLAGTSPAAHTPRAAGTVPEGESPSR